LDVLVVGVQSPAISQYPNGGGNLSNPSQIKITKGIGPVSEENVVLLDIFNNLQKKLPSHPETPKKLIIGVDRCWRKVIVV
jgi:hypothetical protein